MLKLLACRRKAVLLILLPLVFAANEAQCAFLGDVLKPFASVAESYDSNVFRVRDAAQLEALIGDDQMGDFNTVFELGTALHYQLSQQRLDLLLKKDFIRYSHHTLEDADRDEASGKLSLSVLQQLRGVIDGSYTKAPEPRSDFRNPELNLRTKKELGVSAGYDMTSGLSLDAGYRSVTSEYSLAQYRPVEYGADIFSGTASYHISTTSTLFAKYQHEERNYRAVEAVAGRLVKRDNSGDSFRVGFEKTLSPRTAFSGYLGYLDRRYSAIPQRDFSGLIGKLEATYAVTAKLGVLLNGERDLYEETYPGRAYSISDSIGAGAVYQVSEKVKASLQERLVWKDYQAIPGSGAPKRVDFYQELSTGVEWAPIDRLTATLSYQYSTRSSDDASFDFTDHTVTAAVAYKF